MRHLSKRSLLTGASAIAVAAALPLPAFAGSRNLIENSSMGLWTRGVLTRVGNPIPISGWSNYPQAIHAGAAAQFTCPSGIGGIVPGKLMLIEGATAPRAPHVNFPLQVTSNRRFNGPGGTFTGVRAGNWCVITGGANVSPKNLALRVTATDGNTYVDTYSGGGGGDGPEGVYPPAAGSNGFNLVNEGVLGDKTFSITWFAGPAAVDPSVNGWPAAYPPPIFQEVPGASIQAIATGPNTIYASLSGWYGAAAGSGPAIAWEVTPGDEGWGSRDAADGFRKDPTLRVWRTSGIDWDGVTVTNLPGEMYGCKVRKGVSGVERLWKPMCQKSAFDRDRIVPERLARFAGKPVAFNMAWWAPATNTARPFIFDGATYHYGAYFVPGSLNVQEVSLTLPANATDYRCGIETTGIAGDAHYGTQPMAADDGAIGAAYVPFSGIMACLFQTHPIKYIGSPTIAAPQLIRIAQETNGIIPDGCKALFCDLQGQSLTGGSSADLLESLEINMSGQSLFTNAAHVPAASPSSWQAIGQVPVQTPGGTFISESLAFYPNGTPGSVVPWGFLTLGISGVQF